MILFIECNVAMSKYISYRQISRRLRRLSDHAIVGCRDQLRRQGDHQEAQRGKENRFPQVNSINSIGCWVWEGWLLARRY